MADEPCVNNCLNELAEWEEVSMRLYELDDELWENAEDSALLTAGTVLGCLAALAEPTPFGEAACFVAILATLESIDDSLKLLKKMREMNAEFEAAKKAYEDCVENHKWYYGG